MKRTAYLLFAVIILSALSFTSCKEDKYLDWKYLNQSWYNQHKNDESWQKTESGLLYYIEYEGIGSQKPNSKSWIEYQCTGEYFNGKEFQETADLYSTINVPNSDYNIVTGLQEGIKLMKKNAIYHFILPYEIGYGDEKYGSIPPYTTLKFKIILNDFGTN